MDFKKYNKYIGWALFAIAALVYFATMERSVSLWDCGEYIATSNKLEVGHPPGAPLFNMVNRLVSAFVPKESVALVINGVSALCSAFTILFLFWTITSIAQKMARSKQLLLGGKKDAGDVIDSGDETKKRLTDGQYWAVLGSGIIGALTYTFTDSFWFSAVEAEVYAMSSFFTALVFWAIYRWEQAVDAKEEAEANGEDVSNRNPDYWLVFIMFMIGLSIGVHLLNLLAFPAIAYVYYFKKFKKTDIKGFLLTGIIGLVGLQIIQEIIIPKTVSWASGLEIYFTNSMGMPFGSGTIFFGMLLIGLIVAGLWYSRKRSWVNVNTGLMSLAVLYIGYSCFFMIPIRSNADLPIDENNPEDLVGLNRYLLREQYGDWPLFSGPQFTSIPNQPKEYNDKSPVHIRAFVVQKGGKDLMGFRTEKQAKAYKAKHGGTIAEKYYMSDERKYMDPTYPEGMVVTFPRMYSNDDNHISEYMKWSGYPSNLYRDPENARPDDREPIILNKGSNREQTVYMPTVRENFNYFRKYQFMHMFWRYFMWNFSGRQNDDHNQKGDVTIGNWQTGLNFIDTELIGDQSKLPEHRAANYANNKYYLLPLILGLIGLFYQMLRNWKDFFVVMLLFVFTGFMIIIYLNQKPLEPRERDYAYAAAFYTFSIWIGLAVYAIYDLARNIDWRKLAGIIAYPIGAGVFFLLVEMSSDISHVLSYSVLYMGAVAGAVIALFLFLKDKLKEHHHAMAITGLALFVPLLMAFQNWDDHDRSGRDAPRQMAMNYLRPCDKQAILFTNGDNDTFPLWYVQEVEEFRTDIRTCNLSLANTDWYIDQMKRRAYDSDPLPISWEEHEYRQGGYLDVAALPSRVFTYYYFYAMSNSQKTGAPVADDLVRALEVIARYAPKTFDGYIGNPNLYIPPSVLALYEKNRPSMNEMQALDMREALDTLKSGGWKFMDPTQPGNEVSFMPTKRFTVPVDKSKIRGKGIVSSSVEKNLVDELTFTVPKSYLYKAELLILELIAESDWDRPIYFAATAGKSTYLGLHDYFQLEGLVYRLIPHRSTSRYSRYQVYGTVNTDKMYEMATKVWDWGNLKGDGVNVDYYNRRPISNFRLQYLVLAKALQAEAAELKAEDKGDAAREKYSRAKAVLDKSLEEFPDHKVYFDNIVSHYVETYLQLSKVLKELGEDGASSDAVAKADKIAKRLIKYTNDDLAHFTNLKWRFFASSESSEDVAYQVYQGFSVLDELQRSYASYGDSTRAKSIVQNRMKNEGTFLMAFHNGLEYIEEEYDEDDVDTEVSKLETSGLYINLAEIALNDRVNQAQTAIQGLGPEAQDQNARAEFAKVGQGLSSYRAVWRLLYKINNKKLQIAKAVAGSAKSTQQDVQKAQQDAQRADQMLKMLSWLGLAQ